MSPRDLQALHRHLSAATAIVEKLLNRSPDALSTGMRNPAFFRETGHLSDAGIEAIYKLFDEGCSIEEAAKRMGISFRGAASRRQTWAKHRNKLRLAEAGASPPATK
jgi:hypothetical protein